MVHLVWDRGDLLLVQQLYYEFILFFKNFIVAQVNNYLLPEWVSERRGSKRILEP